MVQDINPQGDDWSSPSDLIVYNDKLYFSALTDIAGRELWVYDRIVGVATLVKDIYPGDQ